jgi:hypothetical protein
MSGGLHYSIYWSVEARANNKSICNEKLYPISVPVFVYYI